MRDQAEVLLADARAQLQAAQSAGRSYAIALHRARAARALLVLDRPDEALDELEAARHFVDMLDADGGHDREFLLRLASPGLPPPDEDSGDLSALRADILVMRASALAQLQRWADARDAVDTARAACRGWSRRRQRKALDALADDIARADGTAREALPAIDRALADAEVSDEDRLSARYERAAHLADEGRYDEAIREALTVVRDAGDDRHVTARARQVLGAALAAQGRLADADAALTSAFDDFRANDDDPAIVAAAPGLAWLLGERSEHARATDVLHTAIASADRVGDRLAQADLESALGAALDAQDDAAAAVAAFARAIDTAEGAADAVRAADARHGEAVVRGAQPDPHEVVEALTLLDAAAATYTDEGLPERAAECQHEAGALLARRGSFSAALGRYRSAYTAYQQIPEVLLADDPAAIADCEFNISLLESLADDPDHPIPDAAFASGGHRMQHTKVDA